jgi:hypothetical protein
MPWWDKALKSVSDGTQKATFEAEKLVRVHREESALNDIQRGIQTKLTELGQIALQLHRAGAAVDPAMAGLFQEITALEDQAQQQATRLEEAKASQWQPPVQDAEHEAAGQPAPSAAPAAPAAVQPAPGSAPAAPVAPAVEHVEPPLPRVAPPMPPESGIVDATEADVISKAASTVECPNCHTSVPPTSTFCPECGTRMK